MIFEGGLLVLSAGADRLYALEGVTEAAAAEVIGCWEDNDLDESDLSPEARELLRQLAKCGVLAAPEPARRVSRVAMRWAGERVETLEDRLSELLGANERLMLVRNGADLLLVIRSTARLVDLYPSLEGEPTPHLLLDLAYQHTISLGPLVFHGETACLACLAGRINHFWGDPQPPLRPAVLREAPLAAALAVHELERVAVGDYTLAGATVAYDLDSRQTVGGIVYRLPWCPVCGDGGESAGAADLPWASVA